MLKNYGEEVVLFYQNRLFLLFCAEKEPIFANIIKRADVLNIKLLCFFVKN